MGRVVIRTVVTGFGYWGKIITSRLLEHPHYFVSGVHDPSLAERETARRVANLHTYRTLEDAINREMPDLVCVCTPIAATPSASAYASTRYAHVLAAKPGATSVDTAQRMLRAADAKHVRLVVDYTLTAAPRWLQIKQLVPSLGEVRRIDAVRTTPARRASSDVLDDLVVHDLSLLVDLDEDAQWRVVSSVGDAGERSMVLEAGGVEAYVSAERRGAGVEREFRIIGSKGALTWDQATDSLVCTTDSGMVTPHREAIDAVTARLWMLSRVLCGEAPDNRRVFLEVTRLVEDAREGGIGVAA